MIRPLDSHNSQNPRYSGMPSTCQKISVIGRLERKSTPLPTLGYSKKPSSSQKSVQRVWNARFGDSLGVGLTGAFQSHPRAVDRRITAVYESFDMMGKRLYKTYRDLSNIVVRVSNGTDAGKAHALLVNAHLDSTLPSPGAADDALPCGVMLEAFRVLTQTPGWSPHHAIIFREWSLMRIYAVPLIPFDSVQ